MGPSGTMEARKEAAKATMKRWKVKCEDGFEVVSSKEHELVAHIQQHLKEHHQKVASHDEVMKMAEPA
jgi:hypothetical protein